MQPDWSNQIITIYLIRQFKPVKWYHIISLVKWYHITSRVSFLFTALSHWYPHIICNKTRYFTSEGSERVRYRLNTKWEIPYLQAIMYYFVYCINILLTLKADLKRECLAIHSLGSMERVTSQQLIREFKIWRRQRQRQRHKSMISLVEWRKMIVLHVRHAFWCNVLT